MRARWTRIALIITLALLAISVAGCSQPAQPTQPAASPGSGAASGEQLAQTKCTMCHTYDRVEQAKKDEAGWNETMDRMVDHGLVVTAEEKAAILEYLVAGDK